MEMAEKLHHRDVPPPPIIGEHDLMAVIILILMFGMNLGIKGYFKSREDEKNHQAMEKENLEQQLEYLKYQLNPHFLMNTLNNIHALIEIEPPKAQEAVILLSKILRYVLYESNKPLVLMSQELSFMESYVTLMRMRFDDRLRFTAVNLDDGSDVSVPPLLFISFVENAFKHGVSYQEDSFIEVESKRYQDEQCCERLLWTCRNSKHHVTTHVPKEGGVGMNNVRRRLNLIFTDDYTLDIHEDEQIYEVRLDIPLDVKK
jgi:LytS/YehU family sensor histidine kinase